MEKRGLPDTPTRELCCLLPRTLGSRQNSASVQRATKVCNTQVRDTHTLLWFWPPSIFSEAWLPFCFVKICIFLRKTPTLCLTRRSCFLSLKSQNINTCTLYPISNSYFVV